MIDKKTEDNLESNILNLATLMRENPKSIDKDLIVRGQKVIAIFFDKNFGRSIDKYKALCQRLIIRAIDDLSSGGTMLQNFRLALVYRNNKLNEFTIPYEESNPEGTLAVTIGLKIKKAFEGHRKDEEVKLTEDEVNTSVYLLIQHFSKLM